MSPAPYGTQITVVKLLNLPCCWDLTIMRQILCDDGENVDHIRVVGNIPSLGLCELSFG